jgi:hypothetical protein
MIIFIIEHVENSIILIRQSRHKGDKGSFCAGATTSVVDFARLLKRLENLTLVCATLRS